MWRAIGLILLAVVACVATAQPKAEDKPAQQTVTCVCPGGTLSTALTEVATQLGVTVDFGTDDELDPSIVLWVVAHSAPAPDVLAMIEEAARVRLTVDEKERVLRCRLEQGGRPRVTRGYDVKALIAQRHKYIDRFESERKGQRASATHVLQEVTEYVLDGDETHLHGAAIGSRIVFTRPEQDHERIAELFSLLQNERGGESNTLVADRRYRQQLREKGPRGIQHGATFGAALWRLFEHSKVPAFLTADVLESRALDEPADLNAAQDETSDAATLLARLANRNEFGVDARHGALRMHLQSYSEVLAYRVFALEHFLEQLDQEYALLAERGSATFSQQGAMNHVRDLLESQLVNAGCPAPILFFGFHLIVAGGSDIADTAHRILTEMGWQENPVAAEETK